MDLPESFYVALGEFRKYSPLVKRSFWVVYTYIPSGVLIDKVEYLDPQPCYANLFWEIKKDSSRRYRCFVFSPCDESYRRYHDFILKRSWYRDVFITKEHDACLFEIDTTRHWSEILAALSALRLPRDLDYTEVEVFNNLLSLGYDEKLTFIVYSMLQKIESYGYREKCFHFYPKVYNDHSMFSFIYHGIYQLLNTDVITMEGGNSIVNSMKAQFPITPRDESFHKRWRDKKGEFIVDTLDEKWLRSCFQLFEDEQCVV